MRLIQFTTESGQRAVGAVVDNNTVEQLKDVETIYQLAQRAIDSATGLEALATELLSDIRLDYQKIIDESRLLAPIDHPEPTRMMVAGTGLTHLGSADTRAAMHAQNSTNKVEDMTDTMKMFKMGVEGGKPAKGETGVQPEWFYKGDGDSVVPPEASIPSPSFALDAGEEPEIAGIYINDAGGNPCRIGFAIGNELSDHVTERQNYLYLAHSKLRHCSFGPELLLGDLPKHIEGTSRIVRGEEVIWEKNFLSGEDNMSHTIENLEDHHFKYHNFCRPGHVQVHFFGTATLSFGDGIQPQAGDRFEIESETFGRPLRNSLKVVERVIPKVKTL
ncbi:AraD1 family protein [Microbulbifer harenosus]|uniref:FAH family protein n=1 Tax=Microbulbifer harenosus TaxID=2576840 RepID=A0ABY2UHD7_9GAMM|nr:MULTISPECIES: AraD1 family protein [Microbulbifer]QIL91313.1 FAH family protein [Microbulbifer sp. SH-1]TLM77263.1 FAH family protein [Microbulbifer harenosus]